MAPVENNDPSKARQRTAKASTQAVQNIKAGFYTGSEDKAAWAAFDKIPYPNAPHDGGPQDLANQKANLAAQSGYQGYEAALQAQRDNGTFMDKFGPMIALTLATAGAGMGVGGAVADFTGSAIAGGAAGGAATGALGSTFQGQSLGNIGKSTLIGGLGGGLGAAAAPATSSLGSSLGINPALASGLTRGAIGAGTGALGAKLSGGNVGNAALMGGAGGFLSGALSSATGSNTLGKVGASLGGLALGGLMGGGGGRSTGGTAATGAGGGLNYLGAGGQGNYGNMASTDSTLAGTITGALPGVLQAGATAGGALAGSNAQVGALNNAITTQQSNLGNINGIWNKQQQLGQGADTSLGRALGTNGQPADYSGFENMPGYAFATQQGTQAIQRQAAAMGNAYTPNTAEAVGQYVTGTAMQDYNTYISQLMGAAGLGTTANQGLQTANQNTANNISQAQVDIGQSKAGAYNTSGTAAAGFFSPNGAGTGLIGAAGNYLGANRSGSGGGIGSPVRGPGGSSLFQGPMSNWNNTGAGNGTWGSGYDPNTGSSWTNGVDSSPNQSWFTGPGAESPGDFYNNYDMPTMPSIEGGSTDFGGGLDFGSDTSGGMDFLGGLG